jgi:TolB-like protein
MKKYSIALSIALSFAIVFGVNQVFADNKIEFASVENMAFPLPDKPSFAVLLFDNIGGDPELEYLRDGVTDALTLGLSKVPDVFVIAPGCCIGI